MKIFRCDHCRQLVYFENHTCIRCGHVLAFLPDAMIVASLDPVGDGTWSSPARSAGGQHYRLCSNMTAYQVCNWSIRAESADELCAACKPNDIIPNLSVPGHHGAWYRLEVAKRRLVYTLLRLGLPVRSKEDDPERGLSFRFLADPEDPAAPRVMTGHENGLITLSLAEVDDVERERRRASMHEPYRTLLGHFRHESGHYYWDRLVRDDAANLDHVRRLFGDDREDYGEALKRHHSQGAPPDWSDRFITAYASAHPWEDWAETWAHYLHMVDALETAAACDLNVHDPLVSPSGPALEEFDQMILEWLNLTHVLNNLNRGLGLSDAYPFVLTAPVIEKLRCVHEIVAPITPESSGVH